MEEQYGENKKKGAEFIANFKKEAGVKTTASGLAYQVLKEGNGATPKATDMVQVNYVGKLIDGTVSTNQRVRLLSSALTRSSRVGRKCFS